MSTNRTLAGFQVDVNQQGDGNDSIVTQSGNGYEAGFAEEFWKPLREYWQDQNPQTPRILDERRVIELLEQPGGAVERVVRPRHDHGMVAGNPGGAGYPASHGDEHSRVGNAGDGHGRCQLEKQPALRTRLPARKHHEDRHHDGAQRERLVGEQGEKNECGSSGRPRKAPIALSDTEHRTDAKDHEYQRQLAVDAMEPPLIRPGRQDRE